MLRRRTFVARERHWTRPLTYLPRRARMTEREQLTFETLVGIASRRVKVERNMLRHGGGDNAFRVAVLDETVRALDSVRRARP